MSDELAARFGSAAVFMDVDGIEPGRDFRLAISKNVGACGVLLALIGPTWLECEGASGVRRLDSAADYVRLEIASALQREIPVVPVLVRGARMPKADALPEEIRELAYRHSVELTHARWKSDAQVLMDALAGHIVGTGATVHSKDAAAVDGKALERVSHELACYIGPIAEVVVKRAARHCDSLPELCKQVAQEIEGGADRERFLASCR